MGTRLAPDRNLGEAYERFAVDGQVRGTPGLDAAQLRARGRARGKRSTVSKHHDAHRAALAETGARALRGQPAPGRASTWHQPQHVAKATETARAPAHRLAWQRERVGRPLN